MTAILPQELPAAGSEKKPAKIHWAYLDGLRGLAAMYVVLHHFIAWGYRADSHIIHKITALLAFGHTAVNIFIVLSGFSLMLPVARSADGTLRGGWKEYLKRRAIRIVPPYWAALAISILVDTGVSHIGETARIVSGIPYHEFTVSAILGHFLLIHNVQSRGLSFFNMAHWSVATEWQIYFLLPLLLLPAWRRFGIPGLVITGILIGLIPALFPQVDILHACFWYIGLFAIGGAGAVVATRMLAKGDALPVLRINRSLAAAFLALLALYGLSLKAYPGHAISAVAGEYASSYISQAIRDTLTGCLTLCLILYCVPFMRNANRSSKIVNVLSSPALVKLGAFSYSLYLTHCIVLRFADLGNYLLHAGPTTALLIKTFIGLPAAVGFAYLFHLVCERPFMQILSKMR